MTPICGNVFVFADYLVVHLQSRKGPPVVLPIAGEGLPWSSLGDVAKPVLESAGWHLDAWHRPRNNPQVLLSAFVWKD